MFSGRFQREKYAITYFGRVKVIPMRVNEYLMESQTRNGNSAVDAQIQSWMELELGFSLAASEDSHLISTVYIYIYVYIYICVYMHIYMLYIYMYIYMYIYVYICIYMYMYIYIYTYYYVYIYTYYYVYIYVIYMSYIAIYFLYTDSSKHSHKSAEVQEFQEHARQWISNSCWSCSSWQVDAGSTCISIVSPVPPGFCRDQSALLPSRSTWF